MTETRSTFVDENPELAEIVDHSIWPAKMAHHRRVLAAAVLWDLRLGGNIIGSDNATGELRARLEDRGEPLPEQHLFRALLNQLAAAKLIGLRTTGTRTRDIRLATHKALPPCPFPLEPVTKEPVEAEPAATVSEGMGLSGPLWGAHRPDDPIEAHLERLSHAEALALISRLAGDVLVELAAAGAATMIPDEQLRAVDLEAMVTSLNEDIAALRAENELLQARVAALTTVRATAEDHVRRLLSGQPVQATEAVE